MSRFAAEFAERYVRTESTKDVERIVAQFTPQAILLTSERELVGSDALLDFYREFLAPMVEIDLRVLRAFGDQRGLAFEWEGVTTFENGSVTRALGCDVVTLVNGLIALSTVHLHRIDAIGDAG